MAMTLLELLTREHERLDGLLTQALQLVNRHQLAKALPYFIDFAAGIRLHVQVEKKLFSEWLPLPPDSAGATSVSAALRDHEEILCRLALIGNCYGGGAPIAEDVSACMAGLSEIMAKHERREENELFPVWGACFEQQSQAVRDELFARALGMLQGDG